MKKLLLLLTVLTFTLAGCSILDKEKNLTITLKTGEIYRFDENNISVSIWPNNYIADIQNNEVRGMHIGSTQMLVEGGHTTYNCIIDVQPRSAYYADMTIHLGKSREMIEQMYGRSIGQNGDVYFYGKFMGLEMLPEIENAFVYENGKVVSCAIYFDSRDKLLVANHLLERYEEYETRNNITKFGDAYDYIYSNIVIQYDFSRNPIFVAYTTRAYVERGRSKSFTSLTDQFKFNSNLQ